VIDRAAYQPEPVLRGMEEKLQKWAPCWGWRKEFMIAVIESFPDLITSRLSIFSRWFRDQDCRRQLREFRRCGLSKCATKFQDTTCDSVITSILNQ
jgi:hypothetical protein